MFTILITCGKDETNPGIETNILIDSRDSVTYETITMIGKEWMKENLSYNVGEGCWAYDNNENNVSTFGRLYTWNAAKKACPKGWHLPTDDEWKELEMALGMNQSEADKKGWRGTNEGTKLKTTSSWNKKGNGNNESGFSALPGGFRFSGGYYIGSIGNFAYWWSATENDTKYAWHRWLHFDETKINRDLSDKELGFSVRCVKD